MTLLKKKQHLELGEVYVRPYRRRGRVLRKVVSQEVYERIVRELRRDEYETDLPSDLQSMSSQQRSTVSMQSVGEADPYRSRSTLSLHSARGSTSSLSSNPAMQVQVQPSPSQINPQVPQVQRVAQANIPPLLPELQQPQSHGPSTVQPSYEQPGFIGPQLQTPSTSYGTEGATAQVQPTESLDVYNIPGFAAQPPASDPFPTPTPPTRRSRREPMSKFRKTIIEEQEQRKRMNAPTDPLGQSIVTGLQQAEEQSDLERQQE